MLEISASAAVESKPRSYGEYTIGWVCALPKEMTAAVAMLDVEHPNLDTPNDQNVYTLGSIGKHNIVIACLPKGIIGTSSAAVVATRMVNTFSNIKFGLLVGIGGGIPPKVRLGDVVVGTPIGKYPGVVQWDFGKAIESKEAGGDFQETGTLNKPPDSLLTALTKLETNHNRYGSKISHYLTELGERYPKLAAKYLRSELLKDVAFKTTARHVDRSLAIAEGIIGPEVDEDEEEDEDEDSCRFCDKTNTFKDNDRGMSVHYGLIASGNQVIKNAKFRNQISRRLGGVLCVEMEAAGLLNAFPCLVIRGICDYADAHKNKAWQEHAAAVAAAFAKELLEYVQGGQVDQERAVKDILDKLNQSISRIDNNVESVKQKLDKEEDRRILRWLTETDYGSIQDDKIYQRTVGTGGWILESMEFLKWYRSDMQTLFCPGNPGTGKSIITAIIVDWLLCRNNHDNSEIGVAYIYFDYKRLDEQGIEKVLASLLRQLTQRFSGIPSILKELYKRYQNDGRRPQLEEYLQALLSVATLYSKVFIVVDALDECQLDARREFLDILFDFQLRSRANVFATSRHLHDIEARFTGPNLEITGSEHDLQKYLEASLPSLYSTLENEPGLWEEIKCKIIGAANGVFLLVKLRIDSFKHFLTENEIRRALQEDSRGTSGIYDDTYDEVMERIKRQPKVSSKHAIRALTWLTGAKRELTLLEFQHALAIQVGQRSFDRGDIPNIGGLTSACCGLIAIDKQSNIIRLVHFTAQEYLMKEQRLPNIEEEIAESCLSYLTYDIFRNEGTSPTRQAFGERLQSYPLYRYAATFWGDHARSAAIEDKTSALNLLKSKTAVSACGQALKGFSETRWTWMHLSAFLGMESSIRAMHLLDAKADANAKDDYGQTPLHWAALNGHQAVVQQLLNIKADINAKGNYGQTPLYWAARNGHQAVVQQLLDNKADANANDNKGETPLHWASRSGYQTVQQLLNAKADANAKTNYSGETPLHWAARSGRQTVVQQLLDANANANAKDKYGQIPLHDAARHGRQAVFQLLLNATSNVNVKDKYGLTPLHEAARLGHQTIIQQLLEAKVDANTKDKYGLTPLHIAAENGHQAVVQQLLNAKANVNAITSYNSETPLHRAARNGHQIVVQQLLDSNADANAKNKSYQTPLHEAAEYGYQTVVQQLLNANADANAKNKSGQTPLHEAAENGHQAIVQQLLDTIAETNAKDKGSETEKLVSNPECGDIFE